MSITRRAMRPNQSHIALTAIARSPYRILPLPRSICLVVHPAPTLPSPTDPACFLRGTSHLGHRSSPLLQILTHKLNAALRIPSHIIGDGSPIPRIAASSAAVYVPSAHVPHIFPACLCCIVRTACIRSVSITVFRTSCLTFGCILNIKRVAASSGSRTSPVRSADNRHIPALDGDFADIRIRWRAALSLLRWKDFSLTWCPQTARFSRCGPVILWPRMELHRMAFSRSSWGRGHRRRLAS